MLKIVIVSGPTIVEDNKVLLCKHGEDNFWKFCGGRVEDYDLSLVESAQREVAEEMGVKIEIINPEPFILHTIKSKPEGEIDVILVHYLARRIGEIRPGVDIRELAWLAISDLAQAELAPNILPTLKHFGFLE